MPGTVVVDAESAPISVLVTWPGYHLDGEFLEARRGLLTVGKSVRYDIDVYFVTDPDTGEQFGIPMDRAVIMKGLPILDMKGRLHGGREDGRQG